MATELYLVRHGEAVANVQPVIGGMRGDAGLTPRGRDQARLLQERLMDQQIRADRLVSSTLPRALETAHYVARALGLPVLRDDGLHELRPGEADGLTVEQWRARYRGGAETPGTWDPYQEFSPGGESWATFLARAGGALSRLVARHRDETVVAVCHAGIVEASFALAFGLGASANRVDCAPLNTSLTHWRHRPTPAGTPEWTLISFNDAHHLTRSGAPGQPPFTRASTSPATSAAPAPTSTRAISRKEKPSE
jgi:broad specificity phosphatase PhoE